MIKRSKFTAIMLVTVLGAQLLSGCSEKPATVESVLNNAIEKLEEADSLTARMNMNMDVDMNMMGTSAAIGLDLDLDLEIEDQISHLKGSAAISTLGTTETSDVEVYSLSDANGSTTSYLYTDGADSGNLTEDGEISVDLEVYRAMLEQADRFALSEEPESVDGTDVYVITGTTDMKTVSSLFTGTGGLMDVFSAAMEGAAAENMSVDIKAYFDKYSGDPFQITLDMTGGMDEVMQQAIMDELGEYGIDAESTAVTVNTAVFDMAFTGFNNVEDLEIPQEGGTNDTGDSDGGGSRRPGV